MMKVIDIHSHIIPNVDDGSPNLETSIFLIKEYIKQGVTDVICTPHFRRGMFETSREDILFNYNLLKKEIEEQNLDINLYLGQEIYLRRYSSLDKIFKENRVFSMNDKKYLLLEFSYTNEIDISEIVFSCKLKGYTPIIAHIERYEYVGLEEANDIVEAGGLIQVNASSVIGKHGGRIKKKVKKLIKNDLVSFIASDIHSNRKNYISKTYNYVSKKFGEKLANELFFTNASRLIGENNE